MSATALTTWWDTVVVNTPGVYRRKVLPAPEVILKIA